MSYSDNMALHASCSNDRPLSTAEIGLTLLVSYSNYMTVAGLKLAAPTRRATALLWGSSHRWLCITNRVDC